MDSLSPNNCSKSCSTGSSAASSSVDLDGGKQAKSSSSSSCSRGQKLSRSRSLLQLLSKHLGRHFQHHHHHNDTVYSSQDDIRSSSTDSFSLSYERGSSGSPAEGINGGSSLDLASSTSAYSRYSPGLDYYTSNTDNNTHVYVESVYQRPGSALEHYDEDCNSSSSSSSDEADENRNDSKPRSSLRAGLHLSRISISSSVSRMLQHFSSSNTTTASLRSLSCSSTPLHRRQIAKKSLTPHNSNSSNSSNNSTSSSSSSSSSKKGKKQQSILRPPVQYVYMKGMSGLYSRVPSYAACCPYTLHHMY
ncbi:uncharacterized protein Dwil_GK17650 [Drosophila willistoni]|uniref:Uncharacterized protein n=1 Tax=Drosophila willistoni TaxID=7260 RepID=B4MN76_DROWI|nr:probable serine/threonine-protein kinase dyrk2 [Drosophila willistoni]EDW73632.1 uncharacterized protein Dwil_GK17650 [Drosophila willistoni]